VKEGIADSRAKKEEKKGAKKDEQKEFLVQQKRQEKLTWVRHVYC